MKRIASCLLALLLSALGSAAFGQADYPSRPIHVYVPSTAGGPLDQTARMAAEAWQKRWSQPVVVEARPGGNAMIATELVVKSPPDGYTLLATAQAIGSQSYLLKNPPYNPQRDITPIAIVQGAGTFFTVPVSLPVKSIGEFVAYVRANPGKVNYGEGGIPSIEMEDFISQLGLNITRVRYKGGGPMFAALLAGEIQLGETNAEFATTQAAKVRALAYTDSHRHPALPDVPTIAETVVPGFQFRLWLGIVGPAGIPPAIVTKLNGAVNDFLKTPETSALIRSQGREPLPVTPEDMRREIDAIMKRTEALVSKGVLTPE
jgi:tripartite-type tricarboxylate transporter receptor subunit TctC